MIKLPCGLSLDWFCASQDLYENPFRTFGIYFWQFKSKKSIVWDGYIEIDLFHRRFVINLIKISTPKGPK